MTAFVDNDIIFKLASIDLFDAALLALGVRLADVCVLPTAKFKLYAAKNQEKGRARYGDQAHQRIVKFLSDVQEIDDEPSRKDVPILTNVIGIDAGEALLISSASRNLNSRLVTGDKKSLIALKGSPLCETIVVSLQGRCICLEQLVAKAIDNEGFDRVLARVAPATGCDTVIRAAFGSGHETSERSAREALTAYTEDLKNQTGPLMGLL